MTDMLVKAAENVNIVNNLNNLLMRYGHGRAARLKSRISNQSCSVQSSFKSENPAERILWQVRLKKKNKIILMFLKPSFEYFRTLPPDAALDALSIFRTFRLMAFILPVPVLFIAISSSGTSLYFSTTAKHVDKKQNNAFINLSRRKYDGFPTYQPIHL